MLDISDPPLALRINAYGHNLRQAILRSHPSLNAFADRLGTTRNDIYAWCNGQRLPSMPAHAKLIHLLGYDPLTDRPVATSGTFQEPLHAR